jgi:hypothetical protein
MERREVLKRTALIGGSAVLGTSLFSLLQACQSKPRIDWKPIFLNVEQAQLISTLVDTLLPKTQTPGALDVKVDIFIDAIIGKVYNETAQKTIVEGMAKFEANCQEKFGNTFANLNDNEKKEILKAEESSSPKFNGQVWGTAVNKQEPVGFYRTIKAMALWGYFSSEAIGKNILSYDPIPGEYLGCIPLSDVGNTWSL